MKLGAFDYLPKPFTPDEMAAVARRRGSGGNCCSGAAARPRPAERRRRLFAGIVGASPQMQEVYRLIRKVAPTASTVLIIGETGTGKELVARAIHALSPRKHERFFAVDCGALSVSCSRASCSGT